MASTLAEHTMPDDSLTISFDLAREARHRCVEEHRAESPRWRAVWQAAYRRFITHLVVALILTGAAGMLLIADANGAFAVREGLLVGAFAVAACWWVWGWTLWPGTEPPPAAAVAYFSDHVVRLSPRGVEVRQPALAAHYAWPAIVEISETPSAVVLEHLHGQEVFIPRSAFGDSAAYRSFMELARSLHAASGFDPPGRIGDYLRVTDATCPKCRKNLRGCTERSCPGCGCVLDFYALPEAMQHLPRGKSSAVAL